VEIDVKGIDEYGGKVLYFEKNIDVYQTPRPSLINSFVFSHIKRQASL
jgi:hypothetical protein